MQLKLTDSIVDDPYFSPLLSKMGTRLSPSPPGVRARREVQFEFALEFMETEETLAEQGLKAGQRLLLPHRQFTSLPMLRRHSLSKP